MIHFVPLRSIALRMPSFGRGYDCPLGIQRNVDGGIVGRVEVEGGSGRVREECTCGACLLVAIEGEVAKSTLVEHLVIIV